MRSQTVRGLRFCVTGLANTLIHAFVAYLCLKGFFLGIKNFVAGPVLANAVAFVTSTMFSYVVNTYWSFSTKMSTRNFFRFVSVSCVGLLAAMSLAKIAEFIGLPPMGGVLLVVCVMPIVNFALHSLWTYR